MQPEVKHMNYIGFTIRWWLHHVTNTFKTTQNLNYSNQL